MSAHPEFARQTAKLLLDIKAVVFNTAKPFILTSGRAAPVYIDCRKVISFPAERRVITQMLGKQVRSAVGNHAFDAIAGAETVGIAYAAWLAEDFNLPMQYVRKQPKGFGRGAQIEGNFHEGHRLLLVEDVVNYGGSIEKFVKAIRDAGGVCNHACVLFNYGLLPEVAAAIQALNIKLHYLCTWKDMLAYLKDSKYLPDSELQELELFLADPITWSLAHGGKEEKAS